MEKAELKATAVLVVLSMMVAVQAAAQDEPIAATDQREATIVLHVVNYAGLPPHFLDAARARVAKIYERIGVHTVWIDSEDLVAQGQDGRLHLTVLLLSREMAQKKISAEGIGDFVLANAHVPSWRAYIFCDRIATWSGVSSIFSIWLGNLIAHEMGHLVLRTGGHSRRGIMRADAEVNGSQFQNFNETQVRTIHFTMAGATRR